MGWIWREKPDGTRGLAYPVYLGGALAALGLIAAIHRRLSPPGVRVQRTAARGAQVGSITGAAALAAPVPNPDRPAPPGAQSFRLTHRPEPPAASAPAEHSFDAIDAALQPAAEAAAAKRRVAGTEFAALPPAFEGESAPRTVLVGYRDPSADLSAGVPAAPAPPVGLLPRGALIPVFLLTTVDTSNPAAVLQFGLADDVNQHGRCRLRLGTHLLGKVAGRPMRGRLDLVADTVLFPDGTQRAIAATAVEADETGADIRPGLAANYVPPPVWAQTVPYASDFATGFLGLLQSRAQERFALGSGGLTLQNSVPNEAQGAAAQAGSSAINDFTRARLKEIEERYAAYYLIRAGTACWLQLDSDFAVPAQP